LQSIVLTQVFRQRDSAFISLLDEMRKARMTPFSVAQLRQHVAHPPQLFRPSTFIPTYGEAAAAPATSVKEEAKLQVSGGESSSTAGPVSATAGSAAVGGALMSLPSHLSTRLFARNEDSEHENNGRLDALCHGEGAKLMIWLSKDEGVYNHVQSCIAPARLSLRLGAQVMLIRNLDQANRLVNGSRGIVVGFEPPASPERLKGVSMHPLGTPPLIPKVSFQVDAQAGPAGWVTRAVYPEEWTVEEGGRSIASRTQVPLKLAWAISIHKSQGMTISSLEVELASCFEAGQAYVALSRAVSLQTTRILSFDERKVHANRKVLQFYERIEAEQADTSSSEACASGESADSRSAGADAAAALGAAGRLSVPPPTATAAAPTLSAEQRARIEANKAAALARRRSSGGSSTSFSGR